ncbi:MAG: hypothetical protein EOO27_01695 [Comamonadaceae bacterium]|nr:MAG: hypothetical protein EOO27_01695 [Comamonadaceae bacterium]
MSEVIGRGTIELSADSSKLKAGVSEAKRSIKDLGKDVSGSMQEATGKASRSIDNYVKKLQTVAATNGKSARETELYSLSLRGASKAQLEAADSALRMNEGYERGIAIGQRLRVGFIAIAAAASVAAVASVSHSIALLDSLDDISEKSGISVENLSALRFAGEATGTSFDSLKTGLTKLARQMAEAAGGNKEAAATFKALGVEVKNSDGTLRGTDQVLSDIASSPPMKTALRKPHWRSARSARAVKT